MKSLLVCVFLPAWIWTFWPEFRCLFGARSSALAVRDSLKCRDLITSEWYQNSFRPDWALRSDQNLKQNFANTRGGMRQCVGRDSNVTGFRGDGVFWDDILGATEAHSEAERAEAIRFLKALSSRVNDPRTAMRAGIMQRLHEEDPSGYLLKQGGYEHLCLASEFEPERRNTTALGWTDPRTQHGELLFPARYTKEVLDEAKKDLGSDGYAGQHQQRPAPAGGSIFKLRWWKYWQPAGIKLPPVQILLDDGSLFTCDVVDLPEELDGQLQSWDMTFKDTDSSDFVSGQVWGWKQKDSFLLDRINDRLDMPETVRAVRDMTKKWPLAATKLVEDKANGPAVISTLQHEIAGLIAVDPAGGKVARARAVTPFIESGNVYLPHPLLYPWVEDYRLQHTNFPNGTYDDDVDGETQALRRIYIDGDQDWGDF